MCPAQLAVDVPAVTVNFTSKPGIRSPGTVCPINSIFATRAGSKRERAKKYINTDFLVEHDIHDNDGLFVLLFSGKCWTGARG